MSRDDEEYEEPEIVYIEDESQGGEPPQAFFRDEMTMLYFDMKSEEAQSLLGRHREVLRARANELIRRNWSWLEDD